jgi:hypothetical protein
MRRVLSGIATLDFAETVSGPMEMNFKKFFGEGIFLIIAGTKKLFSVGTGGISTLTASVTLSHF